MSNDTQMQPTEDLRTLADPTAAWGVGLVIHARAVFRGDELSERAIQREISRLRDR
jgi:hypothetical protein